MIELKGKYNSAKVFTNNIDAATIGQLSVLLDQEFISGSQIRIMPDTHAGKGSCIGFTQKINKEKPRVNPNMVGVDIGCVIEVKRNHIGVVGYVACHCNSARLLHSHRNVAVARRCVGWSSWPSFSESPCSQSSFIANCSAIRGFWSHRLKVLNNSIKGAI